MEGDTVVKLWWSSWHRTTSSLQTKNKNDMQPTKNDPPILISFKFQLELTNDAKPPEYESGQEQIYTSCFGWGVQVNLVPRLKFPYMDNGIQRSSFAVSNHHLGHNKQNIQ